jgi:hypothetical protein
LCIDVRIIFATAKPPALGVRDESIDFTRQAARERRLTQRGANPSIRAIGTKLDDLAVSERMEGGDHQPMSRFEIAAGGGE